VSVALPRLRDFRGVPTRAFDGRGNYTLGIKDHTIFPEIDATKIDKSKGLNVTIVTTAGSDDRARVLQEPEQRELFAEQLDLGRFERRDLVDHGSVRVREAVPQDVSRRSDDDGHRGQREVAHREGASGAREYIAPPVRQQRERGRLE